MEMSAPMTEAEKSTLSGVDDRLNPWKYASCAFHRFPVCPSSTVSTLRVSCADMEGVIVRVLAAPPPVAVTVLMHVSVTYTSSSYAMPSEVASHMVFSLPPTTVVGTLKVEGRTGRMLLRSGLARANCMEGKRRLAATGVPNADCTPICNVRLMSALTVCGMSWLLCLGQINAPV